MLTSRMRQDVRATAPDDRNASADAKARQANPEEWRRSTVAARTDGSSSTTEITCILRLGGRRCEAGAHARSAKADLGAKFSKSRNLIPQMIGCRSLSGFDALDADIDFGVCIRQDALVRPSITRRCVSGSPTLSGSVTLRKFVSMRSCPTARRRRSLVTKP